MSDYIPFELQAEIMKSLPVKSLIRFQSVCKPWKSLIDSSDFIKQYNGQPTNLQHLFLSYYDYVEKHVSIADDHTFPHQKHHLILPSWLIGYDYDVIGCSHGLLCLSYKVVGTKIAIIWNFLIRKAVALLVPNVANEVTYASFLGFGVCRETTDPEIVKLTPINCIYWQVMVFTLSTGAWRTPYCTNVYRKPIRFNSNQVVIDGILYWLAADRIMPGYNLIISFDMTSEEFREVKLPHGLHQDGFNLSLSKLRESLVVLEHDAEANNQLIGVWMMKDGVSKVFTKLFTINAIKPNAKVLGFRKSGEPIISFPKDGRDKVFYEPTLNIETSHHMIPYMETLLLLNDPDLTVHNALETLEFEDDFLLEPSFSYWFNGIFSAYNY